MTNDDLQTDGSDASAGPSRRAFVGAAGATVLGSVAALAVGEAQAAQPTAPAPGKGVQGALEVKAPPGLGPKAMPDNRFPVTFSESVPKGVEVLMGYFTALNQRNLKGMAEYLHFPFGTFEGTDPVVVNTPEELMTKTPASMSMHMNPERFSDHDGYMKPGCYDVFRGLQVMCMDPINCTLAMTYDRHGSDGKKLLRCEGVYSITNNDGRWAIQLMSTIFTPSDMIGVEFPEVALAVLRQRVDLDLAYQVANYKNFPGNQKGPNASVEMEALPYTTAPEGKVMERYHIKGVKSRLRWTPGPNAYTQEQFGDDFFKTYRESFQKSGLGNWGFVYGRNPDSRVLHHTFNKAHVFTGATRFLAAGEECSSNYDVEVVTWKEGVWGVAGYLGYTTPHDRSNDVLKT